MWIPIDTRLHEHPTVLRIAVSLKLPAELVVGLLARLWVHPGDGVGGARQGGLGLRDHHHDRGHLGHRRPPAGACEPCCTCSVGCSER
jgi:hypothetical protein